MSDFRRCPTCGEYGWISSHRCPPQWEVVLLEDLSYTYSDPSYWKDVYADTPPKAAEKYIERSDCLDAEFTETSFVVVRVPDDPDTLVYCQVSGELVPEYEAFSLDSLEDAKAEYKKWSGYEL